MHRTDLIRCRRVGKSQSLEPELTLFSFRYGVKPLRNLLSVCGATLPATSRFLRSVGMTKYGNGLRFGRMKHLTIAKSEGHRLGESRNGLHCSAHLCRLSPTQRGDAGAGPVRAALCSFTVEPPVRQACGESGSGKAIATKERERQSGSLRL